MTDAQTALAAAEAAAASSTTAGTAATEAAEHVVTTLAHRNAAETARDEAEAAANTAATDAVAAVGPVNDTVMSSVDADAGSAFRVQQDARLSATFARRALPTKALAKAAAGTAIKVTVVPGDSIYAGSTAGTPGTNDAISLLCSGIASRYGITVTKDNLAQDGRTAIWSRIEKWTLALAANADVYVLAITGKNDIAFETGSGAAKYVGVKTSASLAHVENMVRELRSRKPGADIIIASGNPYQQALYSTQNAAQKTYSRGLARIAAHYGLPYSDGWNAVKDPGGDYAAGADLSDGVHPNTSGHAKLGASLLSLFPAAFDPANTVTAPAASLPERIYTKHATRFASLTTSAVTANTDRIITPSTTGSWTGTGPWTTSTAGDKIDIHVHATDVFLKFTGGAGQGVISLYVGGQPYATNLDLSTISTRWLTIPDLATGIDTVRVIVVSGTVTLQEVQYNVSAAEWIDCRDSRVTIVNNGVAADNDKTYGTHANRCTGTRVDTIEFVGTGLATQGFRDDIGGYGVFTYATVTVDGVAAAPFQIPNLYMAPGSLPIVSGLEYGRHVVVLTYTATDFRVGGWAVLDERPEAHQDVCSGVAKVGETVRFSLPYLYAPAVQVTSTTANAAGASTVTAANFLVTGTAGDLVRWSARGAQRVLY